MTSAALTFVLVHGSWHDGSTFRDVIAHLEAAGHRAYAPTLAGHGLGVDRKVTHADCVNSVVDFIEGEGLSNVVLIAPYGDLTAATCLGILAALAVGLFLAIRPLLDRKLT
jgi:pimeloyl-ACP methyl ester carboxylesterase